MRQRGLKLICVFIGYSVINQDTFLAYFTLVIQNKHYTMCVPNRVAELLDGKGAGKKGRYQGKANKIQKRTDVEKMLRDYFAGKQP